MKKNWKTGLICLLTMVMTFSLFGCGEEKTDSKADSSSVSDTDTDSSADEDMTKDADSKTEDDSSAAGEEKAEYGAYDVVYDDTVNEACAEVIKNYFTAIEEQNFADYKATLYDYYYEVYDGWLKDNYNYGMETTMEQMHQMLLDAAGGDGLVITGITVKPSETEISSNEESSTEDASAEETDLATQYLGIYENLLGEGFTEQVQQDVDEALVISFTMTGTVGGEEKTIMENYDLMMVQKNGTYYILG